MTGSLIGAALSGKAQHQSSVLSQYLSQHSISIRDIPRVPIDSKLSNKSRRSLKPATERKKASPRVKVSRAPSTGNVQEMA